jgi:hypothetical protein
MSADTKLDNAVIKEALCKHFNVSSDKSDLAIREKRFLGLGGNEFRYYYFTLTDGARRHRAFGKVAGHLEREYRSLQYLMKTIPEKQRCIGQPIALLKDGNSSLLLLEYLEGYSNSFTIFNSLRFFPNREASITRIGKYMLDGIYDLQKHAPTIYSRLSVEDTSATPGQPVPTSVFRQIEDIKSISIGTKAALRTRINGLLQNQTIVRRGLVHGTLGTRNIMMNRTSIAFIDWAYMQCEGICIYDPCYIATMLLIKGVQLFIPRSKLDRISEALFQHIKIREDSLTPDTNRRFVNDALWFAKCLSMVDTLYEYETGESSQLKAVVGQKHRKIKYLALHIEKDAANGAGCEGSRL